MLGFVKNIVRKFFSNIYFVTMALFFVWIVFFDSNSLLNRIYLEQKRDDLKEQKTYYNEQIQDIKKNMKELSSDPSLLEKFAREKYLFKRKGEDVYIIEETNPSE